MNMSRKIFSKAVPTILLACFASGGACYEVPQEVSSENMVAAYVFTSYSITEQTSAGGECSRSVTGAFRNDSKNYRLKSPARVTFNNAELHFEQSASNRFGCDAETAVFVFTGNRGETKRDVYEIKKIQINFPATLDRARDSRIPMEFNEKSDYEIEVRFKSKNDDKDAKLKILWVKDEAELTGRLSDPDIPENLSYILRREKLLFIPAAVLSPLAAGDLETFITVEQRVFKFISNDSKSSVGSAAFAYKYNLQPKLKLK